MRARTRVRFRCNPSVVVLTTVPKANFAVPASYARRACAAEAGCTLSQVSQNDVSTVGNRNSATSMS